MQLPALMDWNATKKALHLSAQVLSAVRKATIDPLPNHLHHSLTPTSDGASTGPLPHIGELRLNYRTAELIHAHNGAELARFDLMPHSQQSLYDAVVAHLHEADYDIALQSTSFDDTSFALNKDHAQAFAEMNWRMFQAIAQAKAHFLGFQTPLVLWSHGFDLSTIWFAAGNTEEKDPHLNVGFSPGTSDTPEPYVYFYAWPEQAQISNNLPSIVTWNTSWSTPGGVIHYSKLTGSQNPDALVTETLLTIYRLGVRSMG